MRGRRVVACVAVVLALVLCPAATPAHAWGGAPDWLKQIAHTPLPKYGEDVRGVSLLDETITTVTDDGEIRTRRRRAWKILNTAGRDLGYVAIHFDSETRLYDFRAWSISPSGEEYQVKERDAVESAAFDGELYADNKIKVVRIPAADPGSIVAFEYEQRERPAGLQDTWWFQGADPVRVARYTLILPAGWTHEERWINAEARPPQLAGTTSTWELQEIAGVKDEPGMPSRSAVEGRMSINFIPPQQDRLKGRLHRNWNELGAWYSQIVAGRQLVTPALKSKTAELTAGKKSAFDKIRALAAFAQREVRYVAVEIGIGSYQPHAAGDVFANRYGDCKDKVTVLATMLREAGVESYYVLVNTTRGVIDPGFASLIGMNHVIIAIQLPADAPEGLLTVIKHPKLGKLLLFDPTNSTTPLGHLPGYLQESRGLLVSDGGGELIPIAAEPPEASQLRITAKLKLDAAGALEGDVTEVRTGSLAANMRSFLKSKNDQERMQFMEKRLTHDLTQSVLRDLVVQNADDIDQDLVIRYHVAAESYARRPAGMLLVRPRVIGRKAESIVDLKDRRYGYEMWGTSLETDEIEIALPPGFVPDELPPPQNLTSPVVVYSSEVKGDGGVLRYQRQYRVRGVAVPREGLVELNRTFNAILADERNSAVLKKSF